MTMTRTKEDIMTPDKEPFCKEHQQIRDFMIRSEGKFSVLDESLHEARADINQIKSHLQEADMDRERMPIKIISWVVGLTTLANSILIGVVVHLLK